MIYKNIGFLPEYIGMVVACKDKKILLEQSITAFLVKNNDNHRTKVKKKQISLLKSPKQ